MAVTSLFASPTSSPVPATPKIPSASHLDLRGLDLTTPYDSIQNNRSPFARNFRMYSQDKGDRRVAISNRKGSGTYLKPVGESLTVSDESVAGATDQLVGSTTNHKAIPFIPTTTGPLTRVSLKLSIGTGIGPIIVEIWTDLNGIPGNKLADSGILSSTVPITASYVDAYFIEAPTLVSGAKYWIVAYIQDDGSGSYIWKSNTASTKALDLDVSNTWLHTNYSLDYRAYIGSSNKILGITRYTPETSSNSTLFASGTSLYKGNDNTGATSTIATGLSASSEDYFFTEMDGKKFFVNGFDELKYYEGTTVTTIDKPNLPILKLVIAHKNLIFGVSAEDPNKLVWSEAPGNDDGAGNLWYNAWLSTSFIYVPNPKAQDPITALEPFQDNLIVYTRSQKYILYGSDPSSFSIRQATGSKGCVHQNAVYADENYMYFAAPDGFYRNNGSQDEKLSDNGKYGVQPEFDGISNKNRVIVTKWRGMVRFYYSSPSSPVNNRSLIWHTVFNEWFLDTDAFVSRAVVYTDGDDPDALIEVNSNVPMVTYAETSYDNLGKAIDFQYFCNYDSFGNPAQRKRIPKLFPLVEGDGSSYVVKVGVDKDRSDSPALTNYSITTGGGIIGQFRIGDGTIIGGSSPFKPKRVRVSGYGYYWQIRVLRKGIGNKVRFIGYVWSVRGKRL